MRTAGSAAQRDKREAEATHTGAPARTRPGLCFLGRACELVLCCEILHAKTTPVVRMRRLARGRKATKVRLLPALLRCIRTRALQFSIEGAATFGPKLVFTLDVGRFR